jgi:hypothetical protein
MGIRYPARALSRIGSVHARRAKTHESITARMGRGSWGGSGSIGGDDNVVPGLAADGGRARRRQLLVADVEWDEGLV